MYVQLSFTALCDQFILTQLCRLFETPAEMQTQSRSGVWMYPPHPGVCVCAEYQRWDCQAGPYIMSPAM